MSGENIIFDGAFRSNVAELKEEQTVRDMAAGMASVPADRWQHEDGSPKWDFIRAAGDEYKKRGGTNQQYIGAVAHAVAELVKEGK